MSDRRVAVGRVSDVLTEDAIRGIEVPHGKKQLKVPAGRGLYLLVEPKAKGWRFRYQRGNKERLMSLGVWPKVSLAEARQKAAALQEQLRKGVDVRAARKVQVASKIESAGQTFGVVGRAFLEGLDDKSPKTRAKLAWLFGLMQSLHGRPISEIKAPDLLRVLKAIEGSDRRETAHRAAQLAARIFRYAVWSGYVETSPAAHLRGALKPVRTKHHAAIVDPKELGNLLRLIDLYPPARAGAALRLAAFLFVRPGELRQMSWEEIDLDKAEWVIPKEKTKMRRAQLVPLARQVVAQLREQQALSGGGRWVFPGRNNAHRPLSDAALSVALKSLWYESDTMTAHGFRSSASTMLNEMGFDSALVELALGHAKRDRVAGIYDRSQRLPERREMMQRWADFLDQLKADAIARAAAR